MKSHHNQTGKSNKDSTARTPGAQELIRDLQARLIELERQNAALHATQKQLNVSFEKYSNLYDLAPVGYVTSNEAGLIVENNLTFSEQLDRERSHLSGTSLLLYTAAEDRSRLQSHFARVFATNDRQAIELLLEKRNGSRFRAQLDTIPAPEDGGSQLCRTSVTDISSRKGVEQGLVKDHEELERRAQASSDELFVNKGKFRILSQEFQALLNAITDTLILFSPEMKVLWTNSENAGQNHTIDSDPARQYCHTLIHNSKTLSPDPIKKCFATGEKEVAIETYHGAVLDLRAFPIKETGRVDSVLLLISDITEKMAMQAEAMQAGHMASLGELASGVAHEISNPITGIINYGQILINECRPNSMERDIGERIVKEGDRIGRIVRTLLSYARDRREEKEPTLISATLEESIILTQAQIRKEGIDLEIALSDDLPEIHANLQQIQQGFINIINNARYALNEKYPGRHEDKRLEISGEKTILNGRPWVRLVFYDQGIGIAAHEIPLITKQFFSTKPFGKGTGLGLSITKKIIEDHGGRLSFESSAGEFTRVVVLFPAEWCRDGGEQ